MMGFIWVYDLALDEWQSRFAREWFDIRQPAPEQDLMESI